MFVEESPANRIHDQFLALGNRCGGRTTSGRGCAGGYATVDGTAAAGSDYTPAAGTLRFEPGETERTIAVATLDDHAPMLLGTVQF